MARLSSDKWDELKAKWLIGKYTVRELAADYGITAGAISQRVKLENWQKLDGEVIDKAIDSRAKLKTELNKLNKETKQTEIVSFHVEAEIDRQATDKARFHEVGANIMAKINSMLDVVDNPSEVKELAMAHKAIYEPRFKTSPDTAIQINNNDTRPIRTINDFYG